MMNIIELVIAIGNEVCEECDETDRDCGLEIYQCPKIQNACKYVEDYIEESTF